MLHTFFGQELFDLVWSEPTRTIAKRLGISDVGLAKACRRADLLLPPRSEIGRPHSTTLSVKRDFKTRSG
jgi:hypothetical protein